MKDMTNMMDDMEAMEQEMSKMCEKMSEMRTKMSDHRKEMADMANMSRKDKDSPKAEKGYLNHKYGKHKGGM